MDTTDASESFLKAAMVRGGEVRQRCGEGSEGYWGTRRRRTTRRMARRGEGRRGREKQRW